MPTMDEIYQNNAFEYDQLVTKEDYKENLKNYLLQSFGFKDKSIIELGAGTGRVTNYYASEAREIQLFDRYEHMLTKAKSNLAHFGNKISYTLCDNLEIERINGDADIILEGWSFGHTISDNSDKIESVTEKLVEGCRSKLKKSGLLIILETMGTNAEAPHAPSEPLSQFYSLLETKYQFHKEIIRTDYQFESNKQAADITGFFFGEGFGKSLRFEKEGVVKEYTGVWSLSV